MLIGVTDSVNKTIKLQLFKVLQEDFQKIDEIRLSELNEDNLEFLALQVARNSNHIFVCSKAKPELEVFSFGNDGLRDTLNRITISDRELEAPPQLITQRNFLMVDLFLRPCDSMETLEEINPADLITDNPEEACSSLQLFRLS